jgi:hypothetical protein
MRRYTLLSPRCHGTRSCCCFRQADFLFFAIDALITPAAAMPMPPFSSASPFDYAITPPRFSPLIFHYATLR